MDIDTPRRIKAARALAGLKSADELAKAIDSPGLGSKTIRKIESGERRVSPMELREIARASGLPYAFFVMDFAALDAVEHLWPSEQDLRALDLEPDQVLAHALELLQERAELARGGADQRVVNLPAGGSVIARISGASTPEQRAAIGEAFAPMIQDVADHLTRTFQERVDALEEEVVSLRRQSGREDLEQELEEAARRRGQPTGSTERETPDRRREAREG